MTSEKTAALPAAPQPTTAKPAPAKKPVVKKVAPAKPALKKSVTVQTAKPKAAVKKPVAKAPLSKTAAKAKLEKAAKAEKVEKAKKPKLVRDSFTIPKAEYVVLDELKQRSAKLTRPAKKSELLRAGIKALAALSDAAFLTALARVPAIKTGRPASAK